MSWKEKTRKEKKLASRELPPKSYIDHKFRVEEEKKKKGEKVMNCKIK